MLLSCFKHENTHHSTTLELSRARSQAFPNGLQALMWKSLCCVQYLPTDKLLKPVLEFSTKNASYNGPWSRRGSHAHLAVPCEHSCSSSCFDGLPLRPSRILSESSVGLNPV